MTTEPETDVESLRQSLSVYKAELAKVIAGMQVVKTSAAEFSFRIQ